MNTNTKRTVLVIMMLLSIFSFFGCESPDQKAEKKILSALKEKYGEEFELEAIGGGYGTMNDNTLKAVVRPKSDKSIRVAVEITKDMKHVYDDYLNNMVAKNSMKEIDELAKSIWGECRIDITNDTKLTYPEHTDLKMGYEEFLKLYPMNTMLIDVYLNSEDYIDHEGNMDQDAEYKKYITFAKMLADKKYVNSLVSMTYLSSDAYSRFEEARSSSTNIDKYFSKEEEQKKKLNFVTRVGYKLLKDGKVKETKEEIYRYFDIWKEEREKNSKKRDDN